MEDTYCVLGVEPFDRLREEILPEIIGKAGFDTIMTRDIPEAYRVVTGMIAGNEWYRLPSVLLIEIVAGNEQEVYEGIHHLLGEYHESLHPFMPEIVFTAGMKCRQDMLEGFRDIGQVCLQTEGDRALIRAIGLARILYELRHDSFYL
ncbi:hypothetical protein J4460_01740 [Candidatus Woesearchaeota archaeon]|nr:MAG: hypothetical protein QS99_C0003G0026 [archaeon GW2011_AR4]MBS3129373.1 hypothetical protein [Candidatus Woesearchaeota archaeon]HIH38414.1 hypothetical protein [Candidatus Woesearchaeota archaeon]HIH48128.1 hypothetical protein [Candidatus Woesearchaeota archaeon]HIJ03427.1 hypothetical protein [Candidatus Woesearchaeota archaeon]